MRRYLLDSPILTGYLKGRKVATLVEPWGALLQQVYPYGLSYLILERYAELRRMLRPPQGPGLIGDIDTLIAATSLVYDLTLVTTDSDFTRVPQLPLMLLPRDLLKA